MSSLTPCEELVTRAEFEAFKQQLINLFGQTEEPDGTPINVLEAGSFAGTAIGAGLVFDLEVLENPTTKATEMFKKTWGGIRKKVAGATRGMSKIGSTAKGAAQTADIAMQANANTLLTVGSIGATVINTFSVEVLSNRLDRTENTLASSQAYGSNLYKHLIEANENVEQANENIDKLEDELAEAVAINTDLIDRVSDQKNNIDDLEDAFKTVQKNNTVLKSNVETLEGDLSEYQEYATEEIGNLKANAKILKENVATSEKNREKLLEFTQELGIRTAKLEGDFTEQSSRMERLAFAQTFARIEARQLQEDVTENRDLIDALSRSAGARNIIAKNQVRRGGGGGIPTIVQNELANQQNTLVSLASSLVGNPTEVEDEETGIITPINTNTTYGEIVRGESNLGEMMNALTRTIPNINDLTSDDTMVTPAQLTEFGTDLREGINTDFNAQLTAMVAASITPQLLNIQNQTTSRAIGATVSDTVCDLTNSPTGCLRTGLRDPIMNSLNTVGDLASTGIGGLNALMNDQILNRIVSMQTFLDTAWGSTTVQKTLTTANTILAFHNAAMLSRNVGSTVGDTLSLILNELPIPGFDGTEINVNAWIESKVDSLGRTLLGDSTYTAIGHSFNGANRILTAGQGILSATHGLKNAVQDGQEIIANRIGILGNTMLEQGIFQDGSFEFMNDNVRFKQTFNKYTNFLEGIEEVAEEINEVIQVGIDIRESYSELTSGLEEFSQARQDFIESAIEFHDNKIIEDEESETNSESPDIENTDLTKNETTS